MDNDRITRRALVLASLAITASGCSWTAQPWGGGVYSPFAAKPASRYRRRHVSYSGKEPVGTIVVDTSQRYLYSIEDAGWAMRYGVAVGEEGRTLKGTASVGRKEEWPSWTPTANMMQRKPHLRQYAGGVSGGPHNPLGAAALYLYRDGHDSMFRLHGTNEPWTIGQAVSSGCIRLTNEDIVDLYKRTPVGTDVFVL